MTGSFNALCARLEYDVLMLWSEWNNLNRTLACDRPHVLVGDVSLDIACGKLAELLTQIEDIQAARARMIGGLKEVS